MKPELGRVARYLTVPELIIRAVSTHGLIPELDGGLHDEACEDDSDGQLHYGDRLQGRLVNSTKHKLSDIKYDLSYFDRSGAFFGLSNSRFLDEDELDTDDYLSIDMKVELSAGMTKCVFNVRAKNPVLLVGYFGDDSLRPLVDILNSHKDSVADNKALNLPGAAGQVSLVVMLRSRTYFRPTLSFWVH